MMTRLKPKADKIAKLGSTIIYESTRKRLFDYCSPRGIAMVFVVTKAVNEYLDRIEKESK